VLAAVLTLVLTASHGARHRNAAAITADGADLLGVVGGRRVQAARVAATDSGQREADVAALSGMLELGKPSFCGREIMHFLL
jgi:hypothetical protein